MMPPPIVFKGRCWSSGELADLAATWRTRLAPDLGSSSAAVAMVMANRPEAVALFFALASFPVPVILLPPDPAEWRSSPPIAEGTRLVLSPGLRGLAVTAGQFGFRTSALPEVMESRDTIAPSSTVLASPGVVLFTSGSTSLPKPVFRRTASLLAAARDLTTTVGVPRGAGIISALPLARGLGLNHGLMAATVLRSPLAMLERFDPHAVLELFASGAYRYWVGTPLMADVLTRVHAPQMRTAPPTCVVSGRLSSVRARQFEERFGVPLRQVYGSTEAAAITVDAGSPVRSETAGRPLPGVALRIGDDPRVPLPAGMPGRIWISAEGYLMDGYGFPPEVRPAETRDGWWPTSDVGQIDAAGYLTVIGRLDDCFRTDAGQLVSSSVVGAALESFPGVTDVVAMPIGTVDAPKLGVLVETAKALGIDELRGHLARVLPAWAQPQVIVTTDALPRLPSGRPHRRACIQMLEQRRP